ncbi:MAG: glycosyltransferase family 4 protein [Ardenticatenaceae bacterium]|nr:glycosyltransferase family 4 protein [Ardenticatenaceae bacterium]
MRILHVVHQYLPEKVGGTELYTRTLARHQVSEGHDVSVFYASQQTNDQDPLGFREEDGLHIYGVSRGQRTPAQVLKDTFFNGRLEDAFTAVLIREQPDLIHIQHLMGLPIGLVEHINQAGIPYLITLHDYWYLCANAQLLTNYNNTICPGPDLWLNCARCALARAGYNNAVPLTPFIAPIFSYREKRLRRILQGAQILITPTQFTADIYQKMGLPAAKIQVVPHGIDVPEKRPAHTRTDSDLHIAYIGGLSWQKGVHILIDAVNQLPAAGIKLSIIGDTTAFPEYVARLKQQAKHPGISFNGRMPSSQLWATLAQIDLVVVPSLWYETASLIIQEAFAAGVPVAASHIGALHERLEDEVDGRFFPAGNSIALRDILATFLNNRVELEKLRTGIKPVRTMREHLQDINFIYTQIRQ